MDSIQLLELLLKSIDPERCSVAGVFARDLLTIQRIKRYPGCCIANIDDSKKAGQHWVAYYFRSQYDYDFFDSYGLPPKFYGFHLCAPSNTNQLALQSDYSNSCGQFCLYFLHAKTLGFPMLAIIHSFSNINLLWNDKLVRKFVTQFSNSRSFFHSTSIPKPATQISLVKNFVKHVY